MKAEKCAFKIGVVIWTFVSVEIKIVIETVGSSAKFLVFFLE